MSSSARLAALLAAMAAPWIPAAGCGDDGADATPDGGDADTDSDTDSDTGPPPAPGPEFDAICRGADWDADLLPADPHPFGGDYSGVYTGFPEGTFETMKVIPEHPFRVETIHAAFSGTGTARLRLMKTFGRSYPDTFNPGGDLIEPIEIQLDGADPHEWVEIDVGDRGVYLLPTEHYVVVYEHLEATPFLAVEEVGEGDFSRALIIIPDELYPYGVDGNYRLRLSGDYFCRWDEAERWFSRDETQPFVNDPSQRVAVADLDGDGHDDLILNVGGPLAYFGDGAGGFAAPPFDPFPDVPDSTMLVFGDLNNDGIQDAFAARYISPDAESDDPVDESQVNVVLLGDGSGRFDLVPESGVEFLDPTAAAAFGDADGDGFLDIYWGNWLVQYPQPPAVADVFALGNGDGTFAEATASAGAFYPYGTKACYGVLWGDYNNDGWPDIWVGNYGYGANFMFHNLGDGTFVEVGEVIGIDMDGIGFQGGNTFGGDFGDVNNNGYLDLFVANIAHPRYFPWSDPSMLLVNQGPPDFEFVGVLEEAGLKHDEGDVNAAFADFDNDMHLDLVVLSLYRGHFSRLYRNDGHGNFTDVTYQANVAINDSVSGVWLDVDGDGALDLVIANRAGPEYVHLFVNRIGRENNWIQLVLEGTTTNRDAVGARVTLEAGGVTQIREVKGGGGHSNTQQSKVVHFGLAGESSITSTTVRWVGGATETITGLEPNRRYHVVEGSGTGVVIF